MEALRVIAFFLCLASISPVINAEGAGAPLSEKNAYILMDHLLGLSEVGPDNAAQLERYRQWTSVHSALTQQYQFTKGQMKAYLFMVFVAEETAKVEPLEEIAKEIVPLFKKQPSVLLDAIKEAPFLMHSTCEQIRAHFDLFGTRRDWQEFLREYERMFVSALGVKVASDCLSDRQVR